jgi:hypothetical protein
MEFGRGFDQSKLSKAYALGYEKQPARRKPQRLRAFRRRPTDLNLAFFALDRLLRDQIKREPLEDWSEDARHRLAAQLEPLCILRERLKQMS